MPQPLQRSRRWRKKRNEIEGQRRQGKRRTERKTEQEEGIAISLQKLHSLDIWLHPMKAMHCRASAGPRG